MFIFFGLLICICESVILHEGSGGKESTFSLQSCGISSSCMALPANCVSGDEECAIVSWKNVQEGIEVSFEHSSPAESYIGVGFGKTTSMQNTDIFTCRRSADTIGVVSSFSAQNGQPKDYDSDDLLSLGILSDSIGTSKDDTKYSCSFIRPLSIVKDEITFDLSGGNEYYVLIATGGGANGYHSSSRTQTADIVIFSEETDYNFYGGAPVKNPAAIFKTHAVFMYLAWAALVPSGMIGVISMKRGFPEKRTSKGSPIWFLQHQCSMMLSIPFTMIAFILIFVTLQGWSSTAGIHAIIGCLVFCLMLINVILALCRPPPDAAHRKYFYFFHTLVGWGAGVLSLVTIGYGMKLDRYLVDEWVFWLFVVNAIIYLMFMFSGKLIGRFFIKKYSILAFAILYFTLTFTIFIKLAIH